MNDAAVAMVLRLEDVHKYYDEPAGSLHVLAGVDLSLGRGEVTVLMGPSGSGKTTLLQIAGCMIKATRGMVHVAGNELNHAAEGDRLKARRAHFGFVFQSFHLVNALTVYDNVAIALRLRRQRIDKRRVFDTLGALGIAAKAKKKPLDLSGGEKQRVAIARALVGSPSVLLADEPTSQLDSGAAETVCELLRAATIEYRPAVLVATHDPRLMCIADRQLMLDKGVVHG
jgi:putative ABC transport system ATP-binding protein